MRVERASKARAFLRAVTAPLVFLIALAGLALTSVEARAATCPSVMPYEQLSGNGDTGVCSFTGPPSQNGFYIDFNSYPSISIYHKVNGAVQTDVPACVSGMGSGCGGGDGPGVADCTGPGSQCDFTYTYTDHNSQSVTVNFSFDSSSGSASVTGSTFSGGSSTPQTINFTDPGAQTMGTTPTLTASATSGLTVSFLSNTTGVCTVAGTTLTLVSAGSCTIVASQAGDGTYAPAPTVTRTFSVSGGAPTSQTIYFANPGTQTLGSATSPLSATATSGLTVIFSSATTSICTVSGTTLSLVAAGSCTINANQPGNGSYSAAPQVSQTFAVSAATKLTNTVTFTSTPPTDGSDTYAPTVTSSAGLPVIFGISGVCSISNANVVTVEAGQTCTITAIGTSNATYDGGTATQSWARPVLVKSQKAVAVKTTAVQKSVASMATIAVSSNQAASLISGAVSSAISGGFRVGFAENGGPNGVFGSNFSGMRNTENPDGDPFHYASAFPERGGDRYSGGERLGGTGFAFRGLMELSGDLSNGKRLNFSASLNEATRYMEQVNAKAAISAGKEPAAPRMTQNPFDVWVEGKFSTLNTQGFDGEIGSVGIGAHYLFTPKFLAGVMLQIEDAALDSTTDTMETGSVGWMAGPYVAFEVAKDVTVQGRFNWGQADRELLFGGVRDEFEGTRWLAGASISGTWTQGQWTMRPGAAVVYMEDVTESYTDIVGNVMPEVRYAAGQATVGPQFSYRWMPSDGVMVTPRIGANILWTFTENLDIAGGNSLDGEPSGPGGLRGNVDFGLSVAWISGTSIDLSGTYDGVGVSDFESKTGRAMVRVPLN